MTVAEHWLRFGIDGWRLDVPDEIREPGFWEEFRTRCRAIRPDAYLVGEIWRVAPEWLAGDRFDALMDYPLAEAILGFAGGAHLDLGVIGAHREYGANVRADRRAGLRGAAGRAADRLRPRRRRRPAQPPRLARHAAAAVDPRRGPRRGPPRDAPAADAARRPVPLLRGRGGPDRRQRPGLPRRVPLGRVALGRRVPRLRPRARAPAPVGAGAADRGDDRRRGRRRGGRHRAAARRDAARRRGQRRRRAGPARAPSRRGGGRRAARARSRRARRPGPMRWSVEPEGASAITLGPRSGSVLRLA